MEDNFNWEGLIGENTSLPGPTHLNSPLRDHEPLLILGRKILDPRVKGFLRSKLARSKNELRQITELLELKDWTNDQCLIGFSYIQRGLFSSSKKLSLTPQLENDLEKVLSVAQSNSFHQGKSLNLPELNTTIRKSQISDVKSSYALKQCLQELVLKTGAVGPSNDINCEYATLITDSIYFSRIGRYRLFCSPNLIIINIDNQVYLGTRDHLIGLSDLAAQRHTIILTCILADLNKDETYPRLEDAKWAFQWGDHLLELLGNNGYDLIGQWESLCVGVLGSIVPDEFWDNTKFLKEMEREFMDTGAPLDVAKRAWREAVSRLQIAGERNWSQLTQLYGLYRIWGHPTVNSAEGIRKLKTYACKIKPINYLMVDEVNIIFKERFCMDYRARHNTWPLLNLSELDDSSFLKQTIVSNSALFLRDPRYLKTDWLKVKAEQTFQVLPKYNLIKLISDKAMSLNLAELKEQIKEGNIGPAWSRSVLYKWLTSTIGDPMEFLKDISMNGFGEDETVVGVCPKERELKLFARLFGLLTVKKRMYVVLTEAMLAEHVIPYFPEITMLDDSITLMKKLYSNTTQDKRDTHVSIYTSLDFQKWNSHMRYEETIEIFRFFDDLFGLTDVFTRTHEMFNQSQLYLADGTYIPQVREDGKLLEDEYCWSGHLGGIEGLRQKGWTIFTVCILRMALRDTGLTYSLMGQGDNQVLKINYPSEWGAHQIKARHQEILCTLDNILAQIGPPLKLSESWSSSNLFIYGKFPIVQGVPLSMSLKRLCRMFSLDNEGFPTLDSSLSSLTANLQSACNYAYEVQIPFFLYTKEVCNSVIIHKRFNYLGSHSLSPELSSDVVFGVPKDGKRKTYQFTGEPHHWNWIKDNNIEFLMDFMLFPKILGGYSICLLGNLFSNGFPDPLSENIALLKKLTSYRPETIVNILSPLLKDWFDYDMLCEDPVSVNLVHPSSPKESLKRLVQDFLQSSEWIINPNFKEFIQIAFQRQKDLSQALATMSPCNPRIMHSVIESTLVGRAIQVVGQLDKTNTLTTMMMKKTEINVLERVAKNEQQYYYSVLCNLYRKGQCQWNPSKCSRVWAQTLRDVGWNLKITGVTVAPIPESFIPVPCSKNLCNDHPNPHLGYFLIRPGETLTNQVLNGSMTSGDHVPFLGSRTELKTKGRNRDLARKTQPILRQATELLNLINWGVDEDSEFGCLIKAIFKSLTDLPPDLFIPLGGEISGSIEHRWDDSSTKHGGNLSILYFSATHLHLSTNSLIGFQAKGVNFNLHFQALMSQGVCWASQHYRDNPITTIHYHVSCLECIIPIHEEKLDIKKHDWTRMILSLPDNPICWISSDDVPLMNVVSGEMISPVVIPPEDPAGASAFYHLACDESLKMLRSRSIEAGDGRIQPGILGQTNMSWNSRISYKVFMEIFTLTIIHNLFYRASHKTLKRMNSREELLQYCVRVIENYPVLLFTWSASFYMNERLMDEMSLQSWSDKFPADIPLTYNAVGGHTRQHILNILGSWIMDPPSIDEKTVWTSKVSKLGDQYPIFKFLVAQIVSGQGDAKELIDCYLFLKQLIRYIPLDSGNNVSLFWMLNQYLSDVESKHQPLSRSKIMEHWKLLNQANIAFISGHLDKLVSSLRVKSLLESTHSSLTSESLRDLPYSNPFLFSKESDEFSSVNHYYHVGEKDPTLSILDIGVIKGRAVNVPTSAHYKLMELFKTVHIEPGRHVACLADGAGGFSLLCSLWDQVDTVYYNSLFKTSGILDQGAPNYLPAAFVGRSEERKKLRGLQGMVSGESDITQDQFWAQLKDWNQSHPLSLLTCDAEAGDARERYNPLQIPFAVIHNASLMEIPLCIVKSYLNPRGMLPALWSLGCSHYKTVKIWKGMWSPKTHSEVYIICQDPLSRIRPCSLGVEGFIGPSYPTKLQQRDIQAFEEYLFDRSALIELMATRYSELFLQVNYTGPDMKKVFQLTGFRGKEYHFPIMFLSHAKKHVTPIRFGRIHRARGQINLLKFQIIKRWIQGWIIGWLSSTRVSSEDLELVYSSWKICIYSTKVGWSFWVGNIKGNPIMTSTILFPIVKYLGRHELKPIIRMSQLLNSSVDQSLDSQGNPKILESRQLRKSLIPLDSGISIFP